MSWQDRFKCQLFFMLWYGAMLGGVLLVSDFKTAVLIGIVLILANMNVIDFDNDIKRGQRHDAN